MNALIPVKMIEKKILLIRGESVMLDADLAELYSVETKVLVRAVKRNIERFPSDFMFQLDKKEFESLRFHSGTSKQRGGRRYNPYAFTEQGVAMLSSVLRSDRAVQVNIAIMRAFVKLREMMATHKDLKIKIGEMEKKYDKQFQIIFEAIKQLLESPKKPKRQIGFKRERGK